MKSRWQSDWSTRWYCKFYKGQRKGIKIAEKKPLYVLSINSEKNEIVVGPKDKLIKRK